MSLNKVWMFVQNPETHIYLLTLYGFYYFFINGFYINGFLIGWSFSTKSNLYELGQTLTIYK